MTPRLFLMLMLAAFPVAAFAASLPPAGASSCSGCHAANKAVESPVPPLVGRNPADIEAAMRDFRSGKHPASVMDRIAKGFSDDEVNAIAEWYAARKR